MPGVVVTTAVRTGPTTDTVNASSTFFVVGTASRGPVDEARLITGIADFEILYGEYSATHTLYSHVKTYFEEGGSRAYVSRVVGASATAGFLVDGDLTFTAANPGSWSSDVEVAVTPVATGGFRVKVYFTDANEVTSLVYSSGIVYTTTEAVNAVTQSATASAYIVLTTDDDDANLVEVTQEALSAGANGNAVVEADLIDGLDLFLSNLGAGSVAMPGQYGDTVYDALIAHAVENNRVAILAVDPSNTTVEDAINDTETYIESVVNGEYAGMYYPHVTIPGPGGTTLTISPESYVAAKRAVAHNKTGAWAIGAGLASKASFVNGATVAISTTTGQELDDAKINAIRIIQNSVRVYGARSLSTDTENFRFINGRDMLNYIVTEAERRLEDLVFAPIDGRRAVFGQVESTLIAMLEPLRTAGGLFEAFDAEGVRIDSGYSVVVSDAINPISQLADGVVRANVGVRISSISDRIEIQIVKSNLTSSVV